MAENIRDLIKDPETFFLITGEFKKISTLKKKLLNTKRFNKKILILRIKEDTDQLDEIILEIKKFCKKENLPMLLNSPNKFSYKAKGYHLTSKEIYEYKNSKNLVLGASCHSEQDIIQAIDIGCSYAFLSPVIRKNGIEGMGWDSFFALKDKYPQITIVPLGGINESNAIVEAFAGISHWWNHQA